MSGRGQFDGRIMVYVVGYARRELCILRREMLQWLAEWFAPALLVETKL